MTPFSGLHEQGSRRCALVARGRLNMANNPKKVKDPTEVALSAIQEALNITEPNVDPNRASARTDAAPEQSAMPAFEDAPFDFRSTQAAPSFDAISDEPRAPRRAA